MGSTCSKPRAEAVITGQPINNNKQNRFIEKNVIKDFNTANKPPVTIRPQSPSKSVNTHLTAQTEGTTAGVVRNIGHVRPTSDGSLGSSNHSVTERKPGYMSGASTPRHDSMDDSSSHSTTNSNRDGKHMQHSSSVLGLDKMMDDRVATGDLTKNIVHMEVPFGKPIEEVYEGIHDGPVLGSGISGLVRLCTHKATGAQYAVKCLDLGLVETEEGLQQLRDEIAIMCQLDHPNIVRLEEVYESHSEIYLVQELCVGGELFDRLDEQPDYHYSEVQCARLVKQMLCSVRYIHSKGIIHRDLKLENFLFSSVNQDSELKMIDFGLSKHFQYGEVHHEAVGTPYTVAPEVIKGSYDERCDVWAIGVIAYLLLSGDPPFGGCGGPESLFQVRSNILQGRFKFEPEDVWQHITKEAKDFILMMLVTDPNSRPTAKQCQKSPWLCEWANKNKMDSDTRLNANVVKALVNFKEYSDMRKLLCEVLSFTLMPDQITDLRKEFEKLDTDGSGEISLSGLKQVLMQGAGAGSMGALGEEEIQDIFNAMRVRKTETRIHWHEFIAAGLSQCKVDERNLKLAFDRLDSDHKGYISFENVMDLMGRDGAESEDEMREMWSDSMKACDSQNARITYDDFLLLMKGQTKICSDCLEPNLTPQIQAQISADAPMENGLTPTPTSFTHTLEHSASMPPLQNSMQLGGQHGAASLGSSLPMQLGGQHGAVSLGSSLPMQLGGGGLGVLYECTSISESTEGEEDISNNFIPSIQPEPNLVVPLVPTVCDKDDIDDMPLTIDDDEDDFDQKISDVADVAMQKKQDLQFTPPQSPICPPSSMTSVPLKGADLSPITSFTRRRSRSVDDKDLEPTYDGADKDNAHFSSDLRRALPLPEHTHDTKEIENTIHDETLTPLFVNRQLYRAHRKMRLAVVEASKRFEDEQMNRTKAELQAKSEKEPGSRGFGAGLVMRRGLRKEVSSESIRTLMKQREKQHETVVRNAARKAGRGRRKKTVSDMSGMMSAIPPEELKAHTVPESGIPLAIPKMDKARSARSNSISTGVVDTELLLHDINKPEPTVPGVFRKTSDPFQTMGQSLIGLFGSKTEPNNEPPPNSEVIKSLSPSKKSALKLSLSDGELNLMNDGTPNSPVPTNAAKEQSALWAAGVPPPPLEL